MNAAPLWQLAHFPAPSNTILPRSAAAWSKLPAGGAGAAMESWYSCSAGSFDVTWSSVPLVTLTPVRDSMNEPCPPIWVTAT